MIFAAFLSYVIITSFTPGPSNMLVMNEARRFGFKGSIHFFIGIISGFIILGVVTSLLTARLYEWLPIVEPYFKVVGAAYLLYLAWKIALPKKSNDQDMYRQFSFSSGLFFQIINIKSILYFLTATSSFILPYQNSKGSMLFLICLTILIGCAALLLWAIFGSAFKKIFTKYDKIINTIMCLLLIYSAVTLF
ncbi:LysE family transporter [Paenibacillus polymyxa]|uniref:LysE family transporter n=1 Tax=Paenibacillus polymyxa TaxID=1406 RepID=A0AAP3ZZL1_PAEPO|nr:LysE family transporter [Paenibacillus polymyxa]APB74435.1 cysteine/O-acetylserine transporter [Paenibacillus polymyxa]MDH2332128.1 LysE family transporter [Paenibacillus polymyxa]POR25732.1 lysine transporter LysE [Paenibacillus polymyxa]